MALHYLVKIFQPFLPLDLAVVIDLVEGEEVFEVVLHGGQQMTLNRPEIKRNFTIFLTEASLSDKHIF